MLMQQVLHVCVDYIVNMKLCEFVNFKKPSKPSKLLLNMFFYVII